MVTKLIEDLSHVPNIIGALGLSIAAAQKAFNADYLDGIERILVMAQQLLGERNAAGTALSDDEKVRLEAFKDLFKSLLVTIAPPRYQFTETTLTVKLDLAQTMKVGGTVGLGVGYGGIALNAALTVGFGYDYRAAAECRTVIHAVHADDKTLTALLDRAKEFGNQTLALPERSTIDQKLIDQTGAIFEKVIGAKPPEIATKKEPPKKDGPA